MIVAVTAAEKYVAAAYGIVLLAVLVYVLIIALKLVRLERELAELSARLRTPRVIDAEAREEVRVA